MIKWILQKIVGSKNQREVRRIRPTVARINEIEEALQREPEEKLREMTRQWQATFARYHALEVPAKPVVERMGPDELRTTAEALELRLAPLREEFPALPVRIEANPESIEAAKAAFHEAALEFPKSRAKLLEKILP
jgi:preprotein translocase subunit SecA